LNHPNNVERLALYSCKCSITAVFNLDETLDYKIKNLDLFFTLSKNDDFYMENTNATVFIHAISKTNLKDSLEIIHIKQGSYEGFQDLLDKYKITAKLVEDDEEQRAYYTWFS
jgi:fructose-1,6-bisphosphatase